MDFDEERIEEEISGYRGRPVASDEELDCPLCNAHQIETSKADNEIIYYCKKCKTVFGEDAYLRYFLGYPMEFIDET